MYHKLINRPEITPDELVFLEKEFDSIYFNTMTFSCAQLSAGGAIETCKAVAGGGFKNAIAVIRPPGHHAESNRPMGFCIFDNVSIAAKVCQLDYPETCRKVMILDWYASILSHKAILLIECIKRDVHHGRFDHTTFSQGPAAYTYRQWCPTSFLPRSQRSLRFSSRTRERQFLSIRSIR